MLVKLITIEEWFLHPAEYTSFPDVDLPADVFARYSNARDVWQKCQAELKKFLPEEGAP
jgi:hypothetical protein